jgi:hypothetical protein
MISLALNSELAHTLCLVVGGFQKRAGNSGKGWLRGVLLWGLGVSLPFPQLQCPCLQRGKLGQMVSEQVLSSENEVLPQLFSGGQGCLRGHRFEVCAPHSKKF